MLGNQKGKTENCSLVNQVLPDLFLLHVVKTSNVSITKLL